MRRRSEFQKIQSQGRRVNTPSFVLLLSAREDDGKEAPARLGVTASKRVGNAVMRNRVKRVIREAFRCSGSLFDTGLDVVVIARPSAIRLTSLQVLDEWLAVAPRLQKAARDARSSLQAHRPPARKQASPASGET